MYLNLQMYVYCIEIQINYVFNYKVDIYYYYNLLTKFGALIWFTSKVKLFPHLTIFTNFSHLKKLSFCHLLWISTPYTLATLCRSTLIFQTMNYVRTDILSLKYQRFVLSGYKDKGIRKFEFVAKTQIIYSVYSSLTINSPAPILISP